MNRDLLAQVIYDLMVIAFNLLIFVKVFSPREENFFYKAAMRLGCTAIIMGYFTAVYVARWNPAKASILGMVIPSLVLFFFLSRYRDARFFLTFCVVDSVTLVIAFIGKYCALLLPPPGIFFSMAVTFALFLLVLLLGRDYFRRYRAFLKEVDKGWGAMALCSGLIYLAQIYYAVRPRPLMERPEYALSYLLFSTVILSCYAVFISLVFKMRVIAEQKKRLEYENKILEFAYRDALTGLYNRAAYIEQSGYLEQSRTEHQPICCMMFDINNFKQINDTLGHHSGDEMLKRAADLLKQVFSGSNHHIYRMGGDEFAALLTKCSEREAKEKAELLNRLMEERGKASELSVHLAVGYDFVGGEEDSIEKALMRADKNMYRDKYQKKLDDKNLSRG